MKKLKNYIMNIIKLNQDCAVIGNDSNTEIGKFLFNSWNSEINTVLVNNKATEIEINLLKEIAYTYAKSISDLDKRGRNNSADLFKEIFSEDNTQKEKVTDWYFNNQRGLFIVEKFSSLQEAIQEIVTNVKKKTNIGVVIDHTIQENIFHTDLYTVSLQNKSEGEFIFWNSDNWPTSSGGWDLHIIPGYHPTSPKQGRRSYGPLINGDTDALIRATAISSVFSPEEARKYKGFSSSWSYMNHPYKAAGKSFKFTLRGLYQLTSELVDEAVELILCLLGHHPDNNYVGISGGFSSPYDFPSNISGRTGKKLPIDRPRGSEKHCMWTHDVLRGEGVLEEAYIPSWFHEENWINFFTNEGGIFPDIASSPWKNNYNSVEV